MDAERTPTQLDRIEATLDLLLQKVDLLRSAPLPARASTPSATPTGDLKPAPDADLDGQYGDPVIKTDPKRWTGQSYVGKRWSETTPDYLDAVIGLALWKLGKDQAAGDEKKAGYARRDAERALGWKLRLEGGYKAPVRSEADEFGF